MEQSLLTARQVSDFDLSIVSTSTRGTVPYFTAHLDAILWHDLSRFNYCARLRQEFYYAGTDSKSNSGHEGGHTELILAYF